MRSGSPASVGSSSVAETPSKLSSKVASAPAATPGGMSASRSSSAIATPTRSAPAARPFPKELMRKLSESDISGGGGGGGGGTPSRTASRESTTSLSAPTPSSASATPSKAQSAPPPPQSASTPASKGKAQGSAGGSVAGTPRRATTEADVVAFTRSYCKRKLQAGEPIRWPWLQAQSLKKFGQANAGFFMGAILDTAMEVRTHGLPCALSFPLLTSSLGGGGGGGGGGVCVCVCVCVCVRARSNAIFQREQKCVFFSPVLVTNSTCFSHTHECLSICAISLPRGVSCC
jgi:hypothetical protein